MNKLFYFILIIQVLLAASCDTTEIGRSGTVFTELADVSCTECWIKVETTGINLPEELTLYRDSEVVQTITLTENDVVLYDSLLNPSLTYKYKVKIAGATSKEITATTMDTTSHDFTWETYTFGTETSTLFDVAIIDENNIWAVGEIHIGDEKYNAVHWAGQKWEMKRIFVDYLGKPNWAPLECVFALSENEIVFSSGLPYLQEGSGWKLYHLWDMGILNENDGGVNKIWGTTLNDLYFAGRKGTIAHYNGSNWEKIETGTDTKLTDIYGDKDGNNIFITGYIDFKPTVLLKYNGNNIVKVIENHDTHTNTPGYISGIIESVWLSNNKLFTLTNYDLYISGTDTQGEGRSLWGGNPEQWGVTSIRGNGINDIITCGIRGRVWHFNGVNWKIYDELLSETDRLRKVVIKDDICVIAGYRYINGVENFGLIHIGRRN